MGRKNEEKHLSDILLHVILCSVMGITIIKVTIISLHRINSQVGEVKDQP